MAHDGEETSLPGKGTDSQCKSDHAPPTTLQEWDVSVAPILRRIEASALICRDRARQIKHEVTVLRSRPPWLTRALAEIIAAQVEIKGALQQLEQAEMTYHALDEEAQ